MTQAAPRMAASGAHESSGASQTGLSQQSALPQAAAVLAYAGALPLIIAAMLVWLRPVDFGPGAVNFMIVYGGVLIAFFGGVRWGIAVMRPGGPTFAGLLGGAFPLALSMPIFFLEDIRARFAIIIIALPILLWDDLRATRRGSGAPQWYLGVRTPLTILMAASFVIAFAQILANG